MKHFVLVTAILVFGSSCKKAEDRSCFKTTGELVTLDVPSADFTELNLGKRLNYSLVRDTVNFVRIKGGKNLVKSIRVEVIDNILYIENINRCNFLRDLSTIIDLEIHYKNLNRVDGVVSHELTTQDTIFAEFFNLRLVSASGNASLLVSTNYLNGFSNDGNVDYQFAGKTNVAHIQVYSTSSADVRALQVQEKLEISAGTSRAVYCRADGIPLVVNIFGVGDVYYTGTPTSITLNKTGAGNLIKLD